VFLKKKSFLVFFACISYLAGHSQHSDLTADTTGTAKMLLSKLCCYPDLPHDTAIDVGIKLLAYAKLAGSLKYEHMAHTLLGDTYYDQGHYVKALEEYQIALPLREKISLDKVPDLLNDIGRAYRRLGNHAKALEYFYQALDIANERKLIGIAGTIYNNVAIIYESDGNDSLAIVYYKNSIANQQQAKDSAGISLAYSNLGELYLSEGKMEEAEINLEAALAIGIKSKDPKYIGIAYENLGQLKLNQKKFQLALDYFSKSLEMQQRSQVAVYIAGCKLNLAIVYDSLGKHPQALSQAKEAWAIADARESVEIKKATAELLSSLYAEEKNFKEAYYFEKIANELTESMRKDENKNALGKYIANYELEKKELKMIALEKDLKLAEANEYRQKLINYIGMGGSLFLIILIGLLWKSVRQKRTDNLLLSKGAVLLQSKNEELKQVGIIKDKLFSIMAHDFRGPLSSLQGLTVLLKGKHLNEQERNTMLEKLSDQLGATAFFLENLLQWSRNQLMEMKPAFSKVNVTEIVQECIQLLNGFAEPKGIVIQNNIPAVYIQADIEMVRFIFRNLISNAIKFSSEGAVVSLSSTEDQNQICFSIVDQGKGIPKDQIDKLFTLDTVVNSGTRNERGTGLGLMLCRDFIRINNGTISVTSKEGVGTTFTFSLNKAV
jgi:signal transduction histidine kinase/Tfp pilus assembly protein PilF